MANINKRDNSVVSFSYHYGTYCKYYGENNGLISSLLKVFSMFEIRLGYKKVILDVIYLKCINGKRETCLDLKINSLIFDEIMTKFVLN